jgi:hypothetical protein
MEHTHTQHRQTHTQAHTELNARSAPDAHVRQLRQRSAQVALLRMCAAKGEHHGMGARRQRRQLVARHA